MQKSMWTSYFIESTPEQALELLADRGWRTVELSCEHSQVLLDRGAAGAVGREFLGFCGDLGVSVPQGHLKLRANIANPDRAARRAVVDELRRWLDLCAALGIRAAVLHPGGWRMLEPGPIPPDAFALNVESLGELRDHVAGAGIALCLENGGCAGEILRLIEAAGPDGLAVCCDTGHLSVVHAQSPDEGQSADEFIAEAGDLLRAVHLADNDGSADQHRMPFAGGTVDWQGVARALAAVGFAGPLNYEVPGETKCSAAERMEKLDRLTETTAEIFGDLLTA
jgi:sugar phosphate isomerase/epimerase